MLINQLSYDAMRSNSQTVAVMIEEVSYFRIENHTLLPLIFKSNNYQPQFNMSL